MAISSDWGRHTHEQGQKKTKLMPYSTFVLVVVEVEVELGKNNNNSNKYISAITDTISTKLEIITITTKTTTVTTNTKTTTHSTTLGKTHTNNNFLGL